MSHIPLAPQGPRAEAIQTLLDDLMHGGFNRPPRLWTVHGTTGDEYLRLIGPLNQPADSWLTDAADSGEFSPDVLGACISWESWTYPHHINAATVTSQAARALCELLPPTLHPRRAHVVTVLAGWRDGEVLQARRTSDDGTVIWMLPPPFDCPTAPSGEPNIDAMRRLLGVLPQDAAPDVITRMIGRPHLSELFARAKDEGWDRPRLIAELECTATPEEPTPAEQNG